MMAANLGASSKTANNKSERHKLQRTVTVEREDAQRKRIQDLANKVCQWLSQILGMEITPENYAEKLDTGVELCKLQNKLVAGGEDTKIRYNVNAKKNPTYSQDNIKSFIEWCKAFIHCDEVFESNDLVGHKHELKSQMRVLSCLDKVRQKYPSVPETVEEVTETQETDTPDRPDMTPEPEDNTEEKKQEVAPRIQQPASDIDGESQPSSTKPVSIETPGGEESKKEDKETADKPAPEQTTANVSPNNSDLRSRPSVRNEKSESKPTQPEDADDHNSGRDESKTSCNFLYPLILLCLISLAVLGGLYFFTN